MHLLILLVHPTANTNYFLLPALRLILTLQVRIGIIKSFVIDWNSLMRLILDSYHTFWQNDQTKRLYNLVDDSR